MKKRIIKKALSIKSRSLFLFFLLFFLSSFLYAGTLINVGGSLKITKNDEVVFDRNEEDECSCAVKYSNDIILQCGECELQSEISDSLGNLPGIGVLFDKNGEILPLKVDDSQPIVLSEAEQKFFASEGDQRIGYVYMKMDTENQESIFINSEGSFEYENRPLVLKQNNFFDDSKQNLIKTEALVPSAPVVYPPLLEELSFVDDWDSEITESEDPWADFVFSDEVATYEDGIFYPMLMINDEYYSEVEAEIVQSQPSISQSDLRQVLKGLVTDSFFEEFFSNNNEYYGEAYFTSKNVGFEYDESNFSINLSFTVDQIPIRTISVTNTNVKISREDYKVENALPVNPAAISLASNLSLYGMVDYDNNLTINSTSFSFSTSNTVGFANLGSTFNFSLNYLPGYSNKFVSASLSNFVMFYDFVDENLRLSFGNVFSGDNIYSGSAFGISLERSYSYGSGSLLANQYSQTLIVDRDSMVEISVNGVETLTKNLKVGTYSLKDFAFMQGANIIKVKLTALEDASDVREYVYDLGYDSSLLPKSETLWRFSFTISHEEMNLSDLDSSNAGFAIPWFEESDEMRIWLFSYSDYTVFFENQIGISNSLTIDNYFSGSTSVDPLTKEQNSKIVISTAMTKAFLFGTSNINGQFSLDSTDQASSLTEDLFDFTITLRQSFNAPILQPLSLDFSYNYSQARINGSLGYSFKILGARLALSSNVSYIKDSSLTWGANASLGFTFLQGLSLSSSFTISSTTITQDIPFRISVGLSVVLNKNSTFSASASQVITENNFSLNIRPNGSTKNTLQFSLSGLDLADLTDHTVNGTWSYTDDLLNFTFRQQASDSYSSFNTLFNISSSLVFADGHFGMTRNVTNDFLIINPKGIMKKSIISVGSSVNSNTNAKPKVFGNVVYTDINLYKENSIVVFGTSDSLFGSGGTFIFSFKPRAAQAFVVDAEVVPTVTISARIFHEDGTPYVQYSSPIYKVELDDEGIEYFDMSAGYFLFTDDNGRFIVSDLEPGLYCFDLSVDDNWYAICFDVPKLEESSIVVECEDYTVSTIIPEIEREGLEPLPDYEATIYLNQLEILDETKFWDSLFQVESVDSLSTSQSFGEDDGWMSWGESTDDDWVKATDEVLDNDAKSDSFFSEGKTEELEQNLEEFTITEEDESHNNFVAD